MSDVHIPLATFVHPQGAFTLSYPAHWENLVREEGRTCGFGPRERDDVGLWISVLPARVDTEHPEMREGLRQIFREAAGKESLADVREDPSLHHFTLKADSARPGEAGHFWVVSGGDLVLFASTQVPESARGDFERPFDQVMASLRIHRAEALQRLQLANELLRRLEERFPAQDFHYDHDSPEGLTIRGKGMVVFSGNLYRRVREDPGRREELIAEFITGISFSGDDAPSAQDLGAVRKLILPVLKPADHVREDGPTAGVIHRAWQGQVVIYYGIRGAKTLRFILEADRRRWGITADELDRLARENLGRRSFPRKLPAAEPGGGRVILFNSGDGHDSARILHPRLHEVFSPVLGSPFFAAVPDRATLVLFPRGDPAMVLGLVEKVREDFARAINPISPETFLVDREGIRQAP